MNETLSSDLVFGLFLFFSMFPLASFGICFGSPGKVVVLTQMFFVFIQIVALVGVVYIWTIKLDQKEKMYEEYKRDLKWVCEETGKETDDYYDTYCR